MGWKANLKKLFPLNSVHEDLDKFHEEEEFIQFLKVRWMSNYDFQKGILITAGQLKNFGSKSIVGLGLLEPFLFKFNTLEEFDNLEYLKEIDTSSDFSYLTKEEKTILKQRLSEYKVWTNKQNLKELKEMWKKVKDK